MYEENKKSFLEELRSLDESMKRKVAVAATAILMVGVVYIWIGYFDGLVTGISGQPTVADNQASVGSVQQVAGNMNNGSGGSPSFVQNIKSGMAAIGNDFADAWQGLEDLVKSPGQYNIHPSR